MSLAGRWSLSGAPGGLEGPTPGQQVHIGPDIPAGDAQATFSEVAKLREEMVDASGDLGPWALVWGSLGPGLLAAAAQAPLLRSGGGPLGLALASLAGHLSLDLGWSWWFH